MNSEDRYIAAAYGLAAEFRPIATMRHADGNEITAMTAREMDELINEGFAPVNWQLAAIKD